jgi:universal stress protein A
MKTKAKSKKRFITPQSGRSRAILRGVNRAQRLANQKRIDSLALNTIMVPVDFSAGSLKALNFAVSLAQSLDASIYLLHVLDPIYSFGKLDSPRLRPLRAQALEDAKRQLGTLAKRHVRSHVFINWQVLGGVAYSVIVGAAAKSKADLIVMGSEGRTGMNRLFVGSVAEKVVRHAPCPVLVVRDQPPNISTNQP